MIHNVMENNPGMFFIPFQMGFAEAIPILNRIKNAEICSNPF